MLIPGAYEHEDFLQESGRKTVTFGFKGIEREKGPKIGHGYGDKVSDTLYHAFNVYSESYGSNLCFRKIELFHFTS